MLFAAQTAQFVTDKDWMGGAVYGNAFASRARFLEHTQDFEAREPNGHA
jgi:hypothetical protein